MATKEIHLTQGKVTLVDESDYQRLAQWKWSFNAMGYAARSQYISYNNGKRKVKTFLMHKDIVNAPDGMDVDHINGDRLDNRKSNLRACTRSENCQNRKPCLGGASKYKGVTWHKRHKKWHAKIKQDGKRLHLGYFDDELEAAAAYNKAAIRLYKNFACINLI